MGNSPSSVKNDTTVQSQQSSSSSSSTSGSGEVLEPDPRRPPLNFKRVAFPSQRQHSTPGPAVVGTPHRTTKIVPDFDLDIASSMATALNFSKTNSSSSDDATSSSVGSDLSLITGSSVNSSVSSTLAAAAASVSTSSSSTETHTSSSQLVNNLGRIDETSKEGTPEPRATHHSHSHRKKTRHRVEVSSDDGIGIDSIIESLIETGLSRSYSKKLPVTSSQIQYICSKAREILMSQPMFLELAAPVKVVGDIHGQFYDLLRILKLCGFPPHSNYLFLGDYVDRGKQSLETLLLLLCFKIKYPENFFMLRGNHESASITKMYGFYDECKRRSSTKNWKCFVDVFNTLPVAATIGDKIFCVHGGLSPSLNDLGQIAKLARPSDVPDEGLLSDLLWSDPDALVNTWSENDRGVSFTFGPEIVAKFLKKHNMDLIVRAHMVVEDGYEFFAKRKLVTVFSAPNYCGEFDNWGAVMNVNKNLVCSFEMLKPSEKSVSSESSGKK